MLKYIDLVDEHRQFPVEGVADAFLYAVYASLLSRIFLNITCVIVSVNIIKLSNGDIFGADHDHGLKLVADFVTVGDKMIMAGHYTPYLKTLQFGDSIFGSVVLCME